MHLTLQIVSPKASFQEMEVSYPRFAYWNKKRQRNDFTPNEGELSLSF
jgi:hypothetical protein